MFLLRRLTPTSPRAEDFPGIQQEDMKTLDGILKAIPLPEIQWLKTHDFGNGFRLENSAGVCKYSWSHDGPQHEFLDQELEQLRLHLVSKIR